MHLDGNKIDRSELYCDTYESPLGLIYPVFKGDDLVAIEFESPHLRVSPLPESFIHELDDYFAGRTQDFRQRVQLMSGTEFERSVWLGLLDIPYGETRSYKWMAQKVGTPKGSRAVGQALSKNPVPIVLPCHRIIEAGGKLGGYTPGAEIKRRLLQMEFYNREA